MNHVGVRWSMVTWVPPSDASAGTSVAAVAPEPTTTIRLPCQTRSFGQNWGGRWCR
jgi:hypothetical protein